MRLNARLSAEHAAQLTQIQEQTQASVSEIIRRALEVYYQMVCKTSHLCEGSVCHYGVYWVR